MLINITHQKYFSPENVLAAVCTYKTRYMSPVYIFLEHKRRKALPGKKPVYFSQMYKRAHYFYTKSGWYCTEDITLFETVVTKLHVGAARANFSQINHTDCHYM